MLAATTSTYLHGVSFAGRSLPIHKDRAVVTLHDICTHHTHHARAQRYANKQMHVRVGRDSETCICARTRTHSCQNSTQACLAVSLSLPLWVSSSRRALFRRRRWVRGTMLNSSLDLSLFGGQHLTFNNWLCCIVENLLLCGRGREDSIEGESVIRFRTLTKR